MDPVFPKRAEAKTAVTLLAMSQGVGEWIRRVIRECQEKLPQRLKEYITMRIMPMISLEYLKIWPGRHPDMYTFTKDQDGTFIYLQSGRPLSDPLLSARLHHDSQVETGPFTGRHQDMGGSSRVQIA